MEKDREYSMKAEINRLFFWWQTTAFAMIVLKGWNELMISAILVDTPGYMIGKYYGIFIGTLLQS